MHPTKVQLSAWFGFLSLSIMGILSRLPQLNYNQYPFAQCDENIYLIESQRMLLENSIMFNEFRGGGVNFLPTILSVILDLDLDSAALQSFGRILLTVVLGGLAPGFAFLLAQTLTRNWFISCFVGLSTLFSPLLLINSVYWYPDSYIATFALLAVWLTIRLLNDESVSPEKLVVLGIVCGMGLSVKVTFVVVVAVILYLVWRRDRDRFFTPIRKSNLARIGLAVATTWLLINWPALVAPLDFIRNNGGNVVVYQGGTRSVEGILFYAISAGPMSFGVLPSLVLLVGIFMAIKTRSRIGVAASIVLFAGIAVFGLQAQWLHRNMATFMVFGVLLLALGMQQIWLMAARSRPLLRNATTFAAIAWLAITSFGFVGSTQERIEAQSQANSLHAQVTSFVLQENPDILLPNEPGCQWSVYEESRSSGWESGRGQGTLNVAFSNASRLAFVSDPIIRQLPESSLELLTVDLYRPMPGEFWIDKLVREPKGLDLPAAQFSDGFFKYRVFELAP